MFAQELHAVPCGFEILRIVQHRCSRGEHVNEATGSDEVLGSIVEYRAIVPELVDIATEGVVDALRVVEIDNALDLVDEEAFRTEVVWATLIVHGWWTRTVMICPESLLPAGEDLGEGESIADG
jgi:acyl dehydratase